MEQQFSIQQMLVLRKVTRALDEHLRTLLKNYLAALFPMFRPRFVLGDYLQGGLKETAKGQDKAFKDLQALYETVAPVKPFHLPRELNPPIEILSSVPDIVPMEYSYLARTDRESKTVVVTSPLKWMITYSGFAPLKLREMLADRNRSGKDLLDFLLHYLVLHLVLSRQTGLLEIFQALQFPITTEKSAEFGELPLTYISSSISTLRPPDQVIIESTELSGMNVFEEVVNVQGVLKMENPLRNELLQIVRNQSPDLFNSF